MIRPEYKKKSLEMKSKGELQARQGARSALGGMQREFALAAVIRLVVIAVCAPPILFLSAAGGGPPPRLLTTFRTHRVRSQRTICSRSLL